MEYNSKIIKVENDIKKQLNKEIDRDMKPTNFNIMDTVIPNNQIKSGYQKIVGFQQKVPFQLNFSEENKDADNTYGYNKCYGIPEKKKTQDQNLFNKY